MKRSLKRLHTLGDHLGTSSLVPREGLGEEVGLITCGSGATIILQRPSALNSLTLDTVITLYEILKECAQNDAVKFVVIRGEGGKAFSAGGDIRALANAAKTGDTSYSHNFFSREYKLDHMLWTYPKPYVVLMEGITMGGGVGLSIGAKFRVVTDTTLFAMPETSIGFFPDVGGTYFLSRLKDSTGIFLGLTGTRIKAADLLYLDIATHYIPTSDLSSLTNKLCGALDSDAKSLASVLDKESTPLSLEGSMLKQHKDQISRCFSAESVEDILERLVKENTAWAKTIINVLHTKSPTSLKVTFQALKCAKHLTIEKAFEMELRIAMRFMNTHDFVEGVRAIIVDKDQKPKWNPAFLSQVSQQDVDYFFKMFTDRSMELWG